MLSAHSVTQPEPGRPCWADIVSAKLGTTKIEAVRDEGGFFGQLALWNFGQVRVAHVRLQGAAVRGMRRRTGTGRQDFSWLAASFGGGFELCYNGRSAVLDPGRMAILDPRRTYVTTFAANSEVLWVRIPHALLAAHVSGASQVIIDGTQGAGRILFDTLKSTLSQAPRLQAGQTRHLADGLVMLVAAAGAGLAAPSAAEAATPRSTLLRVKTFVLDNLADDSLSAESVAEANGLSARYINKLFEREGASLMRFVWTQRLEAARAALADADFGPSSIGAVAYACGFKSASHFSHAFRRHFGHAPRTERRAGRDAVAGSP
jgi:AraC-like DNA-binding protein